MSLTVSLGAALESAGVELALGISDAKSAANRRAAWQTRPETRAEHRRAAAFDVQAAAGHRLAKVEGLAKKKQDKVKLRPRAEFRARMMSGGPLRK